MKRHKWNGDTCQRCGLTREYKEAKIFVRTRSALRHGIWEDVPVYDFRMRYWYGEKHKFDRPDCQ